MVIFILPAGAFLTLGFTIAAVQKIKYTVEEKRRRVAEQQPAAAPADAEQEADA